MAANNIESDEKLDPVGTIVKALKDAAKRLAEILKQEDKELASEMAEVEGASEAGSGSSGQTVFAQDDQNATDDSTGGNIQNAP